MSLRDHFHAPFFPRRHWQSFLPLRLLGSLVLPIGLEAAYERTCREQHLTADGA